MDEEIKELLTKEISISVSRSGGPGGQHVNKVSTRVEVRLNIPNSTVLNDRQKKRLLDKLSSKLSVQGDLIVTSQESRSQLSNKAIALEKLLSLIEKALTPAKKRIPTKIPKKTKEKRLAEKKKMAEKKASRRLPDNGKEL